MKPDSLKRFSEAPDAGMLLAYTRKKVIFQPYHNRSEAERLVAGQELLELHLFNQDMEYRCITTRSSRYKDGVIEAVIDFPEKDDRNVYKEVVYLERAAGGGKIAVLNHLKYNDDNGMLTVDDYRLRMEEKEYD